MSLGQNLQFLRKRDNITQEQLAETLEVSRQSVSKWESDTSYPEMDKLLQLANLFHCSLDDLIQKDVSTQYVEDKCNYDQFMNQFSKRITLGVGLILSGITITLFLITVRFTLSIRISPSISPSAEYLRLKIPPILASIISIS